MRQCLDLAPVWPQSGVFWAENRGRPTPAGVEHNIFSRARKHRFKLHTKRQTHVHGPLLANEVCMGLYLSLNYPFALCDRRWRCWDQHQSIHQIYFFFSTWPEKSLPKPLEASRLTANLHAGPRASRERARSTSRGMSSAQLAAQKVRERSLRICWAPY